MKKENHAIATSISPVSLSLSLPPLSLASSLVIKIALLENKYICRIPLKLIYSAKRGAALATSLLSLSFFLSIGDFIGLENYSASA